MTDAIRGLSKTEPELKALFQEQWNNRGLLDTRWEDYSGWTLPYLYPDEYIAEGTEFQHDYQALGAQAVTHLANRIAMTLFPPAQPFFRIDLTKDEREFLKDALNLNSEGDIEKLISEVEREAMKNMQKVNMRTAVISALKNLIVLGNTLMFFPPKGGMAQVYGLQDYTVVRDMDGNLVQAITRDNRVCSTLPPDARDACISAGVRPEDEVSILTGITRQEDGKFFVKQELEDLQIVDQKFGLYPADKLPWLALSWNHIRGENYGVGLVEEYAGDFSVYSALSKANLDLASIAADIKYLINPLGQTDVDELNDSESGTFVYGNLDDVNILQLEKISDFKFVSDLMDIYQRRIAAAFMMQSQITRDAERVTRAEIRMNAMELEGSLGGVYSRLAETMQVPVAKFLLRKTNEEFTKLNPQILTGVESLSRDSEHEQMLLFIQDLGMLNDLPEDVRAELNLNSVAAKF